MEHKKDLAYYLALDYDIIVRKLESEGETFFQAFTKELDPIAFYGVGDSPAEAIESFNETKRALFEDHLENDIPIPEPEKEEEAFYSGRFIVRTSPALHRKLIGLAKKDHQSLNSYINGIFQKSSTAEDFIEIFRQTMQSAVYSQAERSMRVVLQGNAWQPKNFEEKRANAA